MAVPAGLEMLHESFVCSLRAENRAPRRVETYTLAVEQFAAYLQECEDPDRTGVITRLTYPGAGRASSSRLGPAAATNADEFGARGSSIGRPHFTARGRSLR